ncbi:MAG: SDR family NAD(P)-dependent oxidoreductase, partial [Microthrixaceae bacterium]|nr:SDR family NAD(P)-dependent oxidoreductase [Microthrixaceae bacterium]
MGDRGSGRGQLAGRTVLVIGGNGGIGLALATGCAAAGADIVLWGRNDTKNHAAVDTLRALGWMHGPSSATSQMRT